MTKLDLNPASLEEMYAGKLVRNLPKDVAVPFVFNMLRPVEVSKILNISKSTCSNIRAGRRSLSEQHQDLLFEWYTDISQEPTTYINGDFVSLDGEDNDTVRVTDANIRDVMRDTRRLSRELNNRLATVAGDVIREFKRDALTSLREITTTDENQLEKDTNAITEDTTTENSSDYMTSEHYDDEITVKGEAVLIRELPNDFDFDGNQARVALMRNLTYVDETGYREIYDDNGQVIDRVKVFNDDEYDEDRKSVV